MNVNEALPTFLVEAGELLRDMQTELLECSTRPADAENVNRIFRGAHTIKGSAGLFGLDDIVAFVHEVEALLDRARQGKLTLDAPMIRTLLQSTDHIQWLVDAAGSNSPLEPAAKARGDSLLLALGARPPMQATEPQLIAATGNLPGSWHVSLRFGPHVLAAGMDPLGFLRYLNQFGAISRPLPIADALPALDQFDPERCYLGFEFAFATDAPREKIMAAFDFVREDSTVGLVPPNSPYAQYVAVLRASGLRDERIAAVLEHCAPEVVRLAALSATSAARDSPPSAPAAAAGIRANASSQQLRTMRIEAGKLDKLITQIGELITASSAASLAARRTGQRELEERTAVVSALIEAIRESSLQLRMVKIGATFKRFQRVVYDVSRESGKQIELLISGEDTELDKTVVEQIGDPLTHLVRNAIDHGIEDGETRRARGKPPVGAISLDAYHDSGTIVITVTDDGAGLNRTRILAKATERGLLAVGAAVNDAEVFKLIFEPGFTTAESVTSLSGRGVGMDVVKRNITAMRGIVTVDSHEGKGTTVMIRLPLTLAIINGFQVAVGDSVFVLPLECIEQCVSFSSVNGADFTSLRGELLPFVRLHDLYDEARPPGRRQSIVIVRHAGRRVGIVVDALLGEFQTVIKPLGKVFRRVDCISGSSILGSGEVALILDVPALIERAVRGELPAARKLVSNSRAPATGDIHVW